MKKLKIKKLEKKAVETKYGIREVYNLRFENNPEKMVSSFIGNWNRGWSEGNIIEIQDSQWKKREYNGKTYWSIGAPPEARQSFSGFDELKKQVEALTERVTKLEGDNLK